MIVFSGKSLAGDLASASTFIFSSASPTYQSFNSAVLNQGISPSSHKLGLFRDGVPPLVTLAHKLSIETRFAPLVIYPSPQNSLESSLRVPLPPDSGQPVRREYRGGSARNQNPCPRLAVQLRHSVPA